METTLKWRQPQNWRQPKNWRQPQNRTQHQNWRQPQKGKQSKYEDDPRIEEDPQKGKQPKHIKCDNLRVICQKLQSKSDISRLISHEHVKSNKSWIKSQKW